MCVFLNYHNILRDENLAGSSGNQITLEVEGFADDLREKLSKEIRGGVT